MITFAEARERAAREVSFPLAEEGLEDDTSWAMICADDDLTDPPLVLVDKRTGEVTLDVVIENLDRIDGMTDVAP